MKKTTRIVFVSMASFLGLCLLVYVFFTGPHDLDQYPNPSASPYRLPWKAGVTRLCVQSNRGVVSHRGWEEYAYDFKMPVGSEVCAARAGTVVKIEVSHDGHGNSMPNNYIAVDHGDGTWAWYLHLKQGGSKVQVGQRVAQGQVIAESGHVGRSMMPHLHFHVTDAQRTKTFPISFNDLAKDRGVPRMFFYYTSGNVLANDNVPAEGNAPAQGK